MKRAIKAVKKKQEDWIANLCSKVTTSTEDYMVDTLGFDPTSVQDHFNLTARRPGGVLALDLEADLTYGQLNDLCKILDPIVQSFDKDAMFVVDSEGLAICTIQTSDQKKKAPNLLKEENLNDIAQIIKDKLQDVTGDTSLQLDEVSADQDKYGTNKDLWRVFLEFSGDTYTTLGYVDIDLSTIDTPAEFKRTLLQKGYAECIQNLSSI